ncbi:MAG TPA: protoporphyrinogen oxidase [Acidimicrobiales bacterium]|nr:protoporphyrinogen oxidase [Acidimicrobiales bacterium]
MSAGAEVDLVVVGGGVSGLAAAWEGVARGASVLVLEASGRAGGEIVTSPFAGGAVDEAADAFLGRVPEGTQLCAELGIEGELVSPATGGAYVWTGGALRRLPSEQLLGLPTDLDALAASGILSPAGLDRVREDLKGGGPAGDAGPGRAAGDPPAGDDEAVGDLVRRHLGEEVLDRLVSPLLGGIWAADTDRLSLQVAAPQVAAVRDRVAEHGGSLVAAAAAARADQLAAAAAAGDRPVFLAPRGGMGRLVGTLSERLGDRVRTGSPVTGLVAEGGRWRVEPAGVVAGAVVVATPAHATAPLVAPHEPGAAAFLRGIDHASVTLVSLAVPREAVDHPLDGSGFLVPRSSGRLLTACSWFSSKWAHHAGDGSTVLLRASAGRDGDDRQAGLDDDAVVAAVMDDLRETMGLRGAPTEVRVSRWPRSFPQPRPGHLAALAAAEADLADAAPRLAVTGAWARGVGVPACIRGGRSAARRALHIAAT